ncbi:MAG: helix-turn-helix transcriptional regulator [Lentisphaeria bacterium]|nr:helix-turn-helix transcriptional regulator [Lentisphaeria bacterium]
MKKGIYQLAAIPRLTRGVPAIRFIGWMPDHVFYHHESRIEEMFICFAIDEDPGERSSIVNGVRKEETAASPRVSPVYPGTVITTLKTVRRDELFFVYSPETVPFWREFFPGSRIEFQRTVRFERLLAEVFERMCDLHTPGEADALDCLVLQLLLEVRIQERRESESREERVIREIASRLAGRFQEPVTVPELLKGTGLSLRTFYRLWNRYYPDSPAAMLQEKRMVTAEHLLQTTRLRVKEISDTCGFSSPLYFYQRFRRKHGCSPAEFRRRSR